MTAPSEPPAPASSDEDALHSLFGVLREHVVQVSAGFRQRVNQRLETGERDDRSNRLGDVVGSLFVEVFNLMGASVEPRELAAEDDDEHE